jgi:hypothetical protein
MEVFGEVGDVYRRFAIEAAGESPCFEAWASAVAEDPEVLRWLGTLPEQKRQPNLVFAAGRWHGVPAPGPYAALRDALLADAGAIRETILARSTQTNEVGRLATLVPAFAGLGDPLGLIEVGASAGLCLFPDRYDYRWVGEKGERTLGGTGGPVLTSRVEGPAPVPGSTPSVAWRAGIDLNPLDVGDADEMAWLENLVWPEQEDRRDRLRRAVAVTRVDPPRILQGDLLDLLPDLVAEAPVVPVVFHSAVIAYLDEGGRARFVRMMSDLVARGACRWVSNEGPRVLPGLPVPEPAAPTRFLLRLDGHPVAWTHGHGHDLRWL